MEPKYNMKSPAVKRLMKEAHELSIATSEYYAQPLDDNLFEWHFTVRGPSETEFQSGVYHGRIILPPEYPMKPPSIILLTPNGRFETNRKICLSISGHHPESWQPSWSIRTALLAIIGFMPTPGHGAIGSLDYSPEERKKLAIKSQEWQCESCNKIKDLLLEVSEENNAATALEAKEIVSQISMKTEGSKERNEEKEPSSPALQESEQPELRQRTVVQSNMNLNQNPIIPTPSSDTGRSPRWDNRRYNILITFLVLTLAALAYRRCFIVGWDV